MIEIEGKTVAIVGKAKSLIGAHEGQRIDSHDLVVRINTRLPLDTRHIVHTGRRTSLIYVNGGINSPVHAAVRLGVPWMRYDPKFRKSLQDGTGYTPFTGTAAVAWFLAQGAAEVFATGMDLYASPRSSGKGGHLRKRRGGGTHDPAKDKELLLRLKRENPTRLSFGGALENVLLSKNPPKHFKGLEPSYEN